MVLSQVLSLFLTLTLPRMIAFASAGSNNASDCLDCCRASGMSTCATEMAM